MNSIRAQNSVTRTTVRFLVLAPFAAFLVACGGEGEAAAPGQGGPRSRPLPAVGTALAETGSVARQVSVSGVVEPIRRVAVNSQLAGAVTAVLVEEGTAVRRGQVIARLEDRELAAQELSAEAAYNVARAAYERAEQLRDRQVITIGEYERDRTAFAAAAAQLEQIRTRRGYATVRAPVDGVVLDKSVETGDAVGTQTRLFTLGDVSTMVVRVEVSELDVVELERGSPARVLLDAYPGRVLNGRIRRVFPAADPATRLVPVEVELDRSAAGIARPGFLARVLFQLDAREGVVLIPASAVVSGTGADGVFVVQNGRALRRTVETGVSSEGRVEVVAGLNAGDTVVVSGANALRDGAEVRITAGPGAGNAAPAGEGAAEESE